MVEGVEKNLVGNNEEADVVDLGSKEITLPLMRGRVRIERPSMLNRLGEEGREYRMTCCRQGQGQGYLVILDSNGKKIHPCLSTFLYFTTSTAYFSCSSPTMLSLSQRSLFRVTSTLQRSSGPAFRSSLARPGGSSGRTLARPKTTVAAEQGAPTEVSPTRDAVEALPVVAKSPRDV